MRKPLIALVLLLSCSQMDNQQSGPAGGEPGAGNPGGGTPGGGDFSKMNVSGTRIRVQYLQGEDGSKSFRGFWDRARNEPCGWLKAEDGKLRCLPWSGAASAGEYFADAACSELLFVSTGCQAAKYGTQATDSCGDSTTAMYSVTTFSPTKIYAKEGPQCAAADPDETLKYYRGTKINPSEFASSELMTE